jgi:hypothetical protein
MTIAILMIAFIIVVSVTSAIWDEQRQRDNEGDV